jgi:hypothetical protein
MAAMRAALALCWRRGRPVERAGYAVGALLLVWGLAHLAILTIGGGSWQGPLSLRKAMSFGLSFAFTLVTIVWVTSFLRLGDRPRAVLLGGFTLACVLETALVSLQAWRGVPSHFNVETSFDSLVARTLAAGGFALVVMILALTVIAFRRDRQAPASLLTAIRIGFVLLCASLAVGGLMIARGMRLVFAGQAAAAYATGGAFKPTHAVLMHAILVLPLLAWMVSFVDWPESRRLRVVRLGSAGYCLVAVIVSGENLLGLSPADTPVWAAGLALLGALALAAAGWQALAGLHAAEADRS